MFHFGAGHNLSPRAGAVIVWCHGVSAPLIYPAGDERVWADVPKERREWDEGSSWWGTLANDSLFPMSRVPTAEEIELAEMEDIKERAETGHAWGWETSGCAARFELGLPSVRATSRVQFPTLAWFTVLCDSTVAVACLTALDSRRPQHYGTCNVAIQEVSEEAGLFSTEVA
jgi:hypothetical protein